MMNIQYPMIRRESNGNKKIKATGYHEFNYYKHIIIFFVVIINLSFLATNVKILFNLGLIDKNKIL